MTPKNVMYFHSKLLLDNCASFTSSRIKNFCQKWKVKLIFRGIYRLSGTGIVEKNHRTIKRMAALLVESLHMESDLTDSDPMFYDRSTLLVMCTLTWAVLTSILWLAMFI